MDDKCPCEKLKNLQEINSSLSDSIHQLANECEKMRLELGNKKGSKRIYTKGYYPINITGKLISWFSFAGKRKRISHVPTLIYNKTVDVGVKLLWEIEADSKKGVIDHAHDKLARQGDYYYCDVTLEQYRTIVSVAESLIGKHYDKPGIMGMVTRKRSENPDLWFCSESQSYSMRLGGKPLSHKPDYAMTPFDCVSSIIWTRCGIEDVK